MKVQNISERAYMHGSLILKPGEIQDVPMDVAFIWLKTDDIVKYASPIDVDLLKGENEILKQQIEDIKTKLESGDAQSRDQISTVKVKKQPIINKNS